VALINPDLLGLQGDDQAQEEELGVFSSRHEQCQTIGGRKCWMEGFVGLFATVCSPIFVDAGGMGEQNAMIHRQHADHSLAARPSQAITVARECH